MADRRLIAIGGGELRAGGCRIDEYIATEAKKAAGSRRACGLFIPTASHDCMPYYNTFHKVYTGQFDIKTDVALVSGREIDPEKMHKKFDAADFIYVGGGNTVYMLERWKECGLLPYLERAYAQGKILCGLSAGAICWFEEMYTDSAVEGEYAMYPALGWIKGKISPHYDERMLDFDQIVMYNKYRAWGIENYAALELVNGEAVKSISGGGRVFVLDGTSGEHVKKTEF
ncbi:MAG: Type 1 glutamine amidotransferase-like domain-containing protein [Clostridiales bacterium]|nr:Type 1 glutamine amidotransferase-like domain-containing protein [Clostridiales bacterium]